MTLGLCVFLSLLPCDSVSLHHRLACLQCHSIIPTRGRWFLTTTLTTPASTALWSSRVRLFISLSSSCPETNTGILGHWGPPSPHSSPDPLHFTPGRLGKSCRCHTRWLRLRSSAVTLHCTSLQAVCRCQFASVTLPAGGSQTPRSSPAAHGDDSWLSFAVLFHISYSDGRGENTAAQQVNTCCSFHSCTHKKSPVCCYRHTHISPLACCGTIATANTCTQ